MHSCSDQVNNADGYLDVFAVKGSLIPNLTNGTETKWHNMIDKPGPQQRSNTEKHKVKSAFLVVPCVFENAVYKRKEF